MRKLFAISSGLIFLLSISLSSCHSKQFEYDASGTFEATEVIISAEASGKIEEFNIVEGNELAAGQYLGYIDTTQLHLQRLRLQLGKTGVGVRRVNVSVQMDAMREEIARAETVQKRIANLFADGAATQQQLDDANSQLAVLQKTLAAQHNSLSTADNSAGKDMSAYDVQIAQIDDECAKSRIVNPLAGTVLTKYAEAMEVVAPGRALYKIADTKNMYLRAYVISSQLAEIKVGQVVTVSVPSVDDVPKIYPGTVSWISDKAEFTPKTIQTKDERQNLVYAIKIAVDNTDKGIKIGMYGDVDFAAGE